MSTTNQELSAARVCLRDAGCRAGRPGARPSDTTGAAPNGAPAPPSARIHRLTGDDRDLVRSSEGLAFAFAPVGGMPQAIRDGVHGRQTMPGLAERGEGEFAEDVLLG